MLTIQWILVNRDSNKKDFFVINWDFNFGKLIHRVHKK